MGYRPSAKVEPYSKKPSEARQTAEMYAALRESMTTRQAALAP